MPENKTSKNMHAKNKERTKRSAQTPCESPGEDLHSRDLFPHSRGEKDSLCTQVAVFSCAHGNWAACACLGNIGSASSSAPSPRAPNLRSLIQCPPPIAPTQGPYPRPFTQGLHPWPSPRVPIQRPRPRASTQYPHPGPSGAKTLTYFFPPSPCSLPCW